jgi:hypothetical protein
MICYRVALRGNHSATWRWKSPPFNSLHGVLERANQGELSTAIAVKQLWDAHCTSWMEIRRLEVELGEGGDHDQPSSGHLTCSSSQALAWTKLLARRVRGELLS